MARGKNAFLVGSFYLPDLSAPGRAVSETDGPSSINVHRNSHARQHRRSKVILVDMVRCPCSNFIPKCEGAPARKFQSDSRFSDGVVWNANVCLFAAAFETHARQR